MSDAPSTRRSLARLLPQLGWIAALMLAVSLCSSARPIAAGFAVGFVDTELAITGHPKFATAQQTINTYRASRLKELDSYKGRTLTDAEKKALFTKNETIGGDIDKKQQEVMAPLALDVDAAIAAVGKASGVEVILEKAAVHYGGTDMTPAVLQDLAKNYQ